MAFKHLIGGAALLALLAGCSSTDTAPTQASKPANSNGKCSAEAAQNLLGQVATAEIAVSYTHLTLPTSDLV